VITVTFGELMLRLTAPGFERFLQTPRFDATFGGGEANVAVVLASLGLESAFVTVLPENNPIADAAIRDIRGLGVDASMIVRRPGRMGIYYLEGGANQRPSRVVYDRANSAIAIAAPEAVDWASVFQGAGWFHITGITPAISESAAALAFEAVLQARSKGVTVSCDLNYRKNLWKWGKLASEVMPDLMRHVNVAIANEEDVQMTLGIQTNVDVHSGVLVREQYRELTNRVLDEYSGLDVIAVTLRESKNASHNGWAACLNNRREFIVSRHYEITNIVDRVGSGDSFAGGLIYGLQKLSDHSAALEFAVAASCLKHSIPGDFCRIEADDVRALVNGNGSGRVQR
jgi:2-dehydro-3-deoxygluconokinase